MKLNAKAGWTLARSVGEARALAAQERACARGRGARAKLHAARRLEELADACQRICFQIRQRSQGEKIADRLVSLADPDARPIRKGKPRSLTQFGYTALLAEDELGFIAAHQVHKGNPPDAPQLIPAVERVIGVTGRPPGTVVADRGFGTAANDQAVAALGVQRVGLQRTGTPNQARRELERTRRFQRMRNWRVGIEARISHLKRGFGLRRTRLRRLPGACTWVGLGIFAYNLQRMTVVGR